MFFVTSFSIKINNYRSNTKILLPSSGADQHTGSKCSTAFIYSRGKGCCHSVFFCRFVDALYICSTAMCRRRPSRLRAGPEVPGLSASVELCGNLLSSIRLQCTMWDSQLADPYWMYVHARHRSHCVSTCSTVNAGICSWPCSYLLCVYTQQLDLPLSLCSAGLKSRSFSQHLWDEDLHIFLPD